MMSNTQCINVMFICNEWGSSKGGLSTFNREFAVNLAKVSSDRIKVHCYVCGSSEEDREDARKQEVNLITARRLPGSSDRVEWLKIPPPELPNPDIVVGHGRKFGSAAYFISDRTKCNWIHFVHVFCEDLGKHKLERSATADAIADNEEKHRHELELCRAADVVVAVGSQLQRKYNKILRDIKVEVITPGVFEKFIIQANPELAKFQPAEAEEFSIFLFGRGSFEDFALKGYDIIGKAVALLGRNFELTFVGSPQGEQSRIQKWFLDEANIAKNQLTIRGYRNYEEIKNMLHEADLVVMPSRTEGFGLVALEAISAGVPVLVSSESGIAKALKNVEGGLSVVVDSEKPEEWAERICDLSKLEPGQRHVRAMHLREQYGKIFSWKKECERFEQIIHELVQRPSKAGQDHNTVSLTSSTATGANWINNGRPSTDELETLPLGSLSQPEEERLNGKTVRTSRQTSPLQEDQPTNDQKREGNTDLNICTLTAKLSQGGRTKEMLPSSTGKTKIKDQTKQQPSITPQAAAPIQQWNPPAVSVNINSRSVMLRTLLRFGRISYNPGDLQIGTPEFIVPEHITQRLYRQFSDTPVTGIRIVSDFDGKLCEFIDPKLVEISKSRYEGIQIAYNETLMLKTRVRYGVISLVDDDVKFVNGNFQIPRLIADTLMENHHATPCGELYVISDEKRNLRFTVKVGKVHQMRSFVNKKRLNII